MKKISSALLILTFILGACATKSPASETPPPAADGTTSASTTDSAVATESTVAGREAVLSEIEKTVSARETSEKDFSPAVVNMKLLSTGGVETGDDGRARVDLMPEGTIIRVGPNSSFTIPAMTDENGKPKTTLDLLFGKVFILLKGGSLDVKTPSGVASVRGSLLSVGVDPDSGRVTATCMEGDCVISGEDGEEMELPQGEETFIDDNGQPMDPFPMDRDEVQNWLDENPEVDEFMSEVPNPDDFPDLPNDFNGDMESLPDFEVQPSEVPTEVSGQGIESTPPPVDDGSGGPPATEDASGG